MVTSLVNNIMSRQVIGQPEPSLGMGATILLATDRHAGTIVDVFLGKEIVVQEDTATITSGSAYDGSAVYSYAPNPHGHKYRFRKDKKGFWRELVHDDYENKWRMSKKGSGLGLKIGVRMEYYDPSF